MLKLNKRVPFGDPLDPGTQREWPTNLPVFSFDLKWIESQFLPWQLSQGAKVSAVLADGEKRIEAIRKDGVNVTTIGNKLPNGSIVRTAEEQRLQQQVESHAQRQTAAKIIEARNSADTVVLPILKDMHRAAQSAVTLSNRYFDKLSCLSRFNADMKAADLAAFKGNYATIIRDVDLHELARLAQNAIDSAMPVDLVRLDVIRNENTRRRSAVKAFNNSELLGLITVPEETQAKALLQQVIKAHETARIAYLDFSGRVTRATTLRMQAALTTPEIEVEA